MYRTLLPFILTSFLLAQPGQGPSPVGVTSAILAEIQSQITLTGVIHPANRTKLATEIDGKVLKVNIRPGMSFKKDDIIMELDRTYLEHVKSAAEASEREARANWELADLQQSRSKNMFKKELISQDDNDTFILNSTAAKARYEKASALHKQSLYQYDQAMIRAPFDGTVTKQNVYIGDWVNQGDSLVTLVSTDAAEVWVEIPEQYYSGQLSGEEVDFYFPHNPAVSHKGKIRALIPDADSNSHTFRIVIDTAHTSDFGFGMMVKATIPTSQIKGVLMVPKDAITYQGPQANIWVVGDDQSLTMTPVEVGQPKGPWIEINGACEPGTLVVTRGNERLFPGMKISPEAVEYKKP